MSKPLSRRQFIAQAAKVGMLGMAAPALGRQPGPNERIHLGLIGCGGRGRAVLSNCARYPDVVVIGACDVWRERREAVVAQFKDTCKPYHDFREMLQQPDLDAVIIATPPHWHALIAIEAAKAGKDFYLEKPMTLHLAESLALRNAVQKHGVITQIGTQIHASQNFRRVVEWVRSGRLGPISFVRTFHVMNQGQQGIGKSPPAKPPEGLDWDLWCGPAPLRPYHPVLASSSFHHCSWMDYSGGWTAGMAPHILDLPVWALDLKYPTFIHAAGGRFVVDDDGDAYDTMEILWRYPEGVLVTWWTSLANSYGFDFHGEPVRRRRLGIYFHSLNGTLLADYDTHRIIPEGDWLASLEPPPATLPPSPGHEREWLDGIKTRQQPSCSVLYHVRVDVPIVLGLLAYRVGRSLRFDPETEQILGDAEATRLAKPEYRPPWRFPEEYLTRPLGRA